MPAVGVVLPTRDRPALLGRAVASVLSQSVRDLDLVVVDDGSRTPAAETLAGLGDPRVRTLRVERPAGPARARNLGLAALSAPWVAFQDDDDEWLPGKLAAQMERAAGAGAHVALIYSDFVRVDASGRARRAGRRVEPPRGDLLHELLRGNFIALPAALVRSSALAELGPFDAELPCFEDWELFLRLAERFEFDCVGQELVRAHDSRAGVNRASSATQARAFEHILEKHRRRIERDPAAHAWFLFHVAHHLCMAGELGRGREYHRRALRAAPSLKRAATFAASLLGRGAYRSLARLYDGLRPAT